MRDENKYEAVFKGAIEGSPAANSDLQIGDVIVSVDGIAINTLDDYLEAIRNRGEKQVMDVMRGDQLLSITLYGVKKNVNINSMTVGKC